MKLDHVTAIVGDSQVASVLARLFGSEPIGSIELPGMSVVTFRLGDVELHVNTPTGPGPVSDHYRAQGAGFHHIAFEVASLEEELSRLGARGFRAKGRPVTTAPGLREIFLDPETTGGVWIQLVERRGDIVPEALDANAVRELTESAGRKKPTLTR
jgi:methylmalonyl-CoA/ethylmalonyl-CoA epimerase